MEMEETLFDTNGLPIAYIDYEGGRTIYFFSGQPVAYMDTNNQIYGFNGLHLAWFEDGIIWDEEGERVGYNRRTLPISPKPEPNKNSKHFNPPRKIKRAAKLKPIFKKNANSRKHLADLLSAGVFAQ